jgi:aminobenzoyl-glutamate utilization protein B
VGRTSEVAGWNVVRAVHRFVAMRTIILLSSLAIATTTAIPAQTPAASTKQRITSSIDSRFEHYTGVANQIWSFAEVGYHETKSSALLQSELKTAGFTVRAGVGGMPTAFVAEFGAGKPIIGILAEFDALPGLAQHISPERAPIAGQGAGHACGHHLFGTASVAAAIATREWLQSAGRQGTIRVYGTPAEEGGGGKIYMVRAGLFRDADVVLDWHAGSANNASPGPSLANKSGKFRFRGVSAHAAGAPWRGRSALDAVGAMNHMVDMMREHVPDGTRIHYVITDGGKAPNVVPDFAEAYYYVRHQDSKLVNEIWERIVKAADGAALGTETKMEQEVVNGVYALLPNETLARLVDANLRAVGGVKYTAEERAFAEKIRTTLGDDLPPITQSETVLPFTPRSVATGGSTDVGDVSWVVPNGRFYAATWAPGTPSHSWQAVAAGGMSIGHKGMLVAAKTLALTAHDLFTDPAAIQKARAEFDGKRGPNFVYRPLIGEREPPLNYRATADP